MNFRALLRSAFPYLVIGIGGFALAYVVMFFFVLPAEIVPPDSPEATADSTAAPVAVSAGQRVDTGFEATAPLQVQRPIEPAPVTAQITDAVPDDTVPIMTPDLVGMSLPDARGVLNRLRLRVSIARDTSSFQPPNTVLRQSPRPDSLILVRGTVSITVSYFPPDSTSDRMRLRPSRPFPSIDPGADTADPLDTPPQLDTLYP